MVALPLLLLIVAALIVYGSLYPFEFALANADSRALHRLLTIDPLGTSRSDILANVALFVPFGLVGVTAVSGRGLRPVRILLVLLFGLALAVALQIVQLFIPSRVPTLTDVVWNGLGLALGALAATLPVVRRLLQGLERAPRLSVPVLLIGAWIAYRLAPFAPSIDVQVIKDSLKPLLLTPRLTPLGTLHDAVAWSIVLHLWADVRMRGQRDRVSLLLIAGVFLAELLVIDNAVSADNLTGALLAVAVWWLVLYRVPGRAAWLAAFLLILLVFQGLAPFELRAGIADFRWAPFAGVLDGSTGAGFVNLLEKTFLYGSLVWLLLEMRLGWAWAALVSVGVLVLIEAAQTVFAHHTPEITDPLLALLIALLLALLPGSRWGAPALSFASRGRRA